VGGGAHPRVGPRGAERRRLTQRAFTRCSAPSASSFLAASDANDS
jgi:hypothetical protein